MKKLILLATIYLAVYASSQKPKNTYVNPNPLNLPQCSNFNHDQCREFYCRATDSTTHNDPVEMHKCKVNKDDLLCFYDNYCRFRIDQSMG
jgi:hypothetical protein